MADKFKLVTSLKPKGDQPQAISKLAEGASSGEKFQTLLGVTGSGKTFSLACVIEKINRPTLVISHNKTLAAQLYAEFKDFFPKNAIEYFVSYYDYYQPEAYIPATDTYIEKDASINERIDRLRLSASSSLMARRDVLVVASVSCIYNLGSPDDYKQLVLSLQRGQVLYRDSLLRRLVTLQYSRADFEFKRGLFRCRGDIVDIYPTYKETAFRLEFFDDTLEEISEIDPITSKKILSLDKLALYPAKHFLVSQDRIDQALKTIEWELEDRLGFLNKQNKLLEAERLKRKTRYDMEMLRECGWCHGIENYSRHISQRQPGSRPYCLLDYFPRDFLMIIDESHATVPQIRGMYNGDRARKEVLVEFGFRLPSCLDNRPLRFDEFKGLMNQVVFVSATPSEYEIKLSGGKVVEQIIRPTGLLDPQIEIRTTANQIDNLIKEITRRAKKSQRTLVTTLTKRMAEDLTFYLKDEGIRVTYLHSDIDTIERAKILTDLRKKEFDCLVGINLLREGLDLPEVSLVAILDADKEGFLRSRTSLIQVVGRAARNLEGRVIMYADRVTESMRITIDESARRRKIQNEYNKKYKITPRTINKAIRQGIEAYFKAEEIVQDVLGEGKEGFDLRKLIDELRKQMLIEAKNLHFEKAAQLRDKISQLEQYLKTKIK
ncbi:MAG: excinuclease ABC subunit UvrB [Candidatus Omnitrophica bacterium]|nr:excinuclease ABC subunit UvrB [Candidatus Omnitrophota bacterium]